MQLFGLDYLSFLDTVTNTVLMPICAFLSCVSVGWIIGPKKAIAELETEGNKFGALKSTVAVMLRFIVPTLIAVVEIFGLIDLIFPSGVFSANGLWITVSSFALLGVAVAVYFLFLKNSETGCNADEKE